MDRWVCKRCFASNEGEAGACTICGWPRGEVFAEANDPIPAYAAPLPAARPGPAPWWRPLLRYGWVAVLLVGAVVVWSTQAHRDSSGRISSGGSMDIGQLQIGDCFDAGDGVLSQVTAHPCSTAHTYELFAIAEDTVDTDYPDDATIAQFLAGSCEPAFAEYVGISLEQSSLGVIQVAPTADGWSRGDRTFLCAAYDPASDRTTGSLRGTRR